MVHCFLPKITLVQEDGQHDAKFFSQVPERPKEDLTSEPHNPLGKIVEVILHNKINGHMDKYA